MSPWGKVTNPEPVKLQDIMSEEVAKDLQAKENKKYVQSLCHDRNGESESVMDSQVLQVIAVVEEEEDSDAVIARMLQRQFDEEYDKILEIKEQKCNGDSKVSISFTNYRRVPQTLDFDSDSEEEELENICDQKDWDRFDTVLRQANKIPACGYGMHNGSMITNHDMGLSGRKNACKIMSFPLGIRTGDGAGFDLQLSNKAFNSLKMYSKKGEDRRHRMHDKREDQATAEFGVDEATRILMYKLINKQILEKVNGVISIGKEAVVLHADTDPAYPVSVLPRECVVKVFKTTLSEFKQREKYIKDDYRFRDRLGKKHIRKYIHLWAEKEMLNLIRMQKAGIPCPNVISLKKHILVMSFVGKDHRPAPKLKDAVLKEADCVIAYEQVVQGMKLLYHKARLIHADLSEYNILWYNGQCYFIDVSQAMEPCNLDAFHFLMRDCQNIINFFAKKNVSEIDTPEGLFRHITGCDYGDRVALEGLNGLVKIKPHLRDMPGIEQLDVFESAWEKSQMGHSVGVSAAHEAPHVNPVTA